MERADGGGSLTETPPTCNDNTSFLDHWRDCRNHSFLIGKLIYAVRNFSRIMDRRSFHRYYIQMVTVGFRATGE